MLLSYSSASLCFFYFYGMFPINWFRFYCYAFLEFIQLAGADYSLS